MNNKQYPYRFKTKEEFINEFGDTWRHYIQAGWVREMDELLGIIYPFHVKKDDHVNLSNYGGYDNEQWNITGIC